MLLSVISPPIATPISVDDCQRHIRLDGCDEDSWFGLAIAAAVEYAEAYCSRSWMRRQLQVTYYHRDCPPRDRLFILPGGPVASIDQVNDQNGNAVATSLYQLQRIGTTDYAYLPRGVWPPVITYTAGYGSADQVPAKIRLAMLMHVAHLWDNRSATTSRPMNHVYHGLEAMYGQASSELAL